MSWTDFMTSKTLLQNTFILRRPKVIKLVDIITLAVKFIKTIFKD